MTGIVRDFQIGFRVLLKNPVATIVAVLALALGIGANAASFVNVNALVLNPLPYANLERIVTLWETIPKLQTGRDPVAPANFLDWREQSQAFEQLAAYRRWSVNLTGGNATERVEAALVTSGYFALLGMDAELGRTFADDEFEPGRSNVVVLSHDFWRNRLAGAPDILRKTISLGGRSYTVTGVMPEDFDFPLATEVWAPLGFSEEEKSDREGRGLLVLGRLKPAVSTGQARAEMATIAGRLERQYPRTNEARRVLVTPLRELTNQVTDRFVMALLGAAAFLLLLAGANVANMQLASATERQQVVAVQTALGASRFRIARSLLAESILIALGGGGLGLLAAAWTIDLNRTSVPPQVFHWVAGLKYMRLDSTTVALTFAVSILVGILCGLPAALQLLRRSGAAFLSETLRQGSRNSSADPARNRLRNILAASEVALALLLLVGAGVMVNTFQNMVTVDHGYNPKNLLTVQISLPSSGYATGARMIDFYDRVIAGLTTVPNVNAVGASRSIGVSEAFFAEGRPEPGPDDPRPVIVAIAGDYFRTMEIPLLQGRAVGEQDGTESPRVVVLNRRVAAHYWPDSSPIGQRVKLGNAQSPWLTVVGVSGNTSTWFTNEPSPAAFVPYRQAPQLAMRLLIRTAGDPLPVAGAARFQIRSVDPEEPIYDVKTMEQILSEERSGVEASARMMTTNAGIALLMAITGIYGVMSYLVSRRAKEIGVRIALGAAARDILRMTLGQVCLMTGTGLAIGVPAAYVLMKVLSAVLLNVVVVKWTTFSGVTALLALCALLAGYIPARRASKVDPIAALRHD